MAQQKALRSQRVSNGQGNILIKQRTPKNQNHLNKNKRYDRRQIKNRRPGPQPRISERRLRDTIPAKEVQLLEGGSNGGDKSGGQ